MVIPANEKDNGIHLIRFGSAESLSLVFRCEDRFKLVPPEPILLMAKIKAAVASVGKKLPASFVRV